MKREVQAMLENSLACRRERLQPLASIQFGLWCLARELNNVLKDLKCDGTQLEPDDAMRCRGILPSLKRLMEIHFPDNDPTLADVGDATLRHGTWFPDDVMEPNFWCKDCKQELGNTYCVGLCTDSKTIHDANGTVWDVLCVDCFHDDIAKHNHNRLLYPHMASEVFAKVREAVENLEEAMEETGSVECHGYA
jgi:hypothetical protein